MQASEQTIAKRQLIFLFLYRAFLWSLFIISCRSWSNHFYVYLHGFQILSMFFRFKEHSKNGLIFTFMLKVFSMMTTIDALGRRRRYLQISPSKVMFNNYGFNMYRYNLFSLSPPLIVRFCMNKTFLIKIMP